MRASRGGTTRSRARSSSSLKAQAQALPDERGLAPARLLLVAGGDADLLEEGLEHGHDHELEEFLGDARRLDAEQQRASISVRGAHEVAARGEADPAIRRPRDHCSDAFPRDERSVLVEA